MLSFSSLEHETFRKLLLEEVEVEQAHFYILASSRDELEPLNSARIAP